MERAELAAMLGASPAKTPMANGQTPKLISEADPQRFMAAFAAAVAGEGGDVFLCDPNWGEVEKAQLGELLQSKVENPKSKISHGWLMIPTGGTSGKLKFARHDQETILAAVVGFARHFSLAGVNATGVLPLHHVSGFMAWMRCALPGGEYRHLGWKAVEQGNLPDLPAKPDGWVISLVPTQLDRLLRQPAATAWLAKFRIVFLGGAPAGRDLLDRAAAARIPLSPGYGMTETAAMVTALRPEEFLAGVRSSGEVLPHAHIAIGPDALIAVAGDSLFRGYYPEWRKGDVFETADLGRLDERGRLHVLGRLDEVINTGGEKVQPGEVEAILRATGEFDDVAVLGLPDPEWGQVVVAAYTDDRRPDLAKVDRLLAAHLAPAKRPRRFVALAEWPRTAAGKLDRGQLTRMVEREPKPNP